MTELIKIKVCDIDGKVNAVNARDLYGYLKSKREFATWVKDRLTDFIEGADYMTILSNRSDGLPGKPRKDYIITLDVAKHIAMTERNEQGREIRTYFIEYEKKGQQLKSVLYDDPVIKMRLDQLEMEKRIQQTEQAVKQIQGKQNQLKTDPEYFAIVGYASYIDMPIDLKIAQQLGKQAKKMCADNGFIVGSIPDPRFGKVHTYPKEVLELVFDSFSMK